jgi:hypothetical protein
MRTLLALALVAPLAVLLPGCPLGCGAYDGAGDQVYSRGNDMLILCENGGFVATLETRTLEGRFMTNPVGSDARGFGVNGEDGQLAFDLFDNPDGTARTPQLGDSPWSQVNLDEVGLDHADSLCQDLVNRPWWTAP